MLLQPRSHRGSPLISRGLFPPSPLVEHVLGASTDHREEVMRGQAATRRHAICANKVECACRAYCELQWKVQCSFNDLKIFLHYVATCSGWSVNNVEVQHVNMAKWKQACCGFHFALSAFCTSRKMSAGVAISHFCVVVAFRRVQVYDGQLLRQPNLYGSLQWAIDMQQSSHLQKRALTAFSARSTKLFTGGLKMLNNSLKLLKSDNLLDLAGSWKFIFHC